MDLKRRMVWSTIYSGLPTKEVAQTFLVSEKTVKRAVQRYFATGDLLSECSNGRPQSLSEDNQVILLQSLLDNPGIYIQEVQEMYQEITGISLHPISIIRYANRFGLTHQRMRRISISRSDMDRAEFMMQVDSMDPAFFIWVDETGCDRRTFLRRMAYGVRGATPKNVMLQVRGKRLSAIAAMSVRGIEDVVINEGNVDGDTFCNFLETNIFPLMLPFDGSSPRSVLILDNASIHHVERIYQLAEAKGCLLWFLPAYSPDLNPIEEVFSKVKAVIKNNEIAFQSCANDTLSLLMYAAFTSVTQADCHNYILHTGYM